MKYRSIEWDFLKGYYELNQIVVINFQIVDMDYEDMKNKGLEAAQILNKLVEKFKNSDNQKLNQSICQKYILEIKEQMNCI